LISNFDQIEEARFSLGDFKMALNGLVDYCNSLAAQIDNKGLAPCFSPDYEPEIYS